ncbi:MAG: DinB family protein [Gemmatimonadetes bacterium]|nr:DinB family protein [Gemmatimonadota bacterium]
MGGVSAGQAAQRPIPRAHTIWELVLHITSWQREVLRRLRTDIAREPGSGDWPLPADTSDAAWRAAVAGLATAHRDLVAEIERFPADALHTVLGDARDAPLGSGVSYYVLLHGIIQHNLAHTAQISLLKKAFAP